MLHYNALLLSSGKEQLIPRLRTVTALCTEGIVSYGNIESGCMIMQDFLANFGLYLVLFSGQWKR